MPQPNINPIPNPNTVLTNTKSPKKLIQNNNGYFEADSLFDDGEAEIIFGENHRFGNEPGPGWKGTRFKAKRYPNGIPISFYADIDNIVEKVKHKQDLVNGDYLEWVCNKKKNGKNQKNGSLIKVKTGGSVEITYEWNNIEDVPDYVDIFIDCPSNVSFFYQPILSQDEINIGAVRPENVIGSYAVYLSNSSIILDTEGNVLEDWKTGKYCHIYCPKLVAKNGDILYLNQTAPIDNPWRLRIYLTGLGRGGIDIVDWITQHISDGIVLDPTFGYTSIGASSNVPDPNYAKCFTTFAPSSSGSAESVSLYVASYTGQYTSGIYSLSSGTPSSLLRDGSDTTPSANAWSTVNLDSTVSIVSGTNYGFGMNNGAYVTIKYDGDFSGKPFDYYYVFSAYSAGTLPSPYPGGASVARYMKISIYSTYTEESGIVIPIFMQQYRRRWQ